MTPMENLITTLILCVIGALFTVMLFGALTS